MPPPLSIVPVVGSSGYYDFLPPFNNASQDKIEYICRGIRSISDYLANNEDIKATIYKANNIEDAIWDEDVKADAYIASFQSGNGHWLYIPCRYIDKYPSTEGVKYRSVMLSFSLPPIPLTQDLTTLAGEIKDMILGATGIQCANRIIDTSRTILVAKTTHNLTQMTRAQAMAGGGSLYSKVKILQADRAKLLAKIAELENYIKTQL